MRYLLLLGALALASCSKQAAVTICCTKHWWGDSQLTFATEADYEKYVLAERLRALQAAKSLPFDYLSCSERVLSRVVTEDQVQDKSIYVSIFASDPSEPTLNALRTIHPKTYSASVVPQRSNATMTDAWSYSLYSMHKREKGGYEAYVNYYCGTTCAGSFRYHLEKDGASCKVLSQEQFGPVS